MTALEAIRSLGMMCKDNPCCSVCDICDLRDLIIGRMREEGKDPRRERPVSCVAALAEYPEESTKIIEDWWNKHRTKTNIEWYRELLESNGFPTEELDEDSCPPTHNYDRDSCVGIPCTECKKWWGEPHKEETWLKR